MPKQRAKLPLPVMTPQEILENFKGKFCLCGHSKKAEQSFCFPHYRALPQYLKNSLWQGWFNGYEESFIKAAQHLGLMEKPLHPGVYVKQPGESAEDFLKRCGATDYIEKHQIKK